MKKKMRFYLPILFILWTGAFLQEIGNDREVFINEKNAIEIENIVLKDMQDIKSDKGRMEERLILFEKEYKGKRSQSEIKQEVSFLLASYEGELVKEVVGDNFCSFYGFSDSVKDYVISDGEKINLNLVITYDEEKDITYVIGASPFYNEDF